MQKLWRKFKVEIDVKFVTQKEQEKEDKLEYSLTRGYGPDGPFCQKAGNIYNFKLDFYNLLLPSPISVYYY